MLAKIVNNPTAGPAHDQSLDNLTKTDYYSIKRARTAPPLEF